MFNIKSKIALVAFILFLLLFVIISIVWTRLGSTTQIGLINFPQFQVGGIIKSNTDPRIQYTQVEVDKFDQLSQYDFVLGYGKGLRITAEQLAQIQKAADKGTPIYMYAATSPNNISNIDTIQEQAIQAYLGSGNKQNSQSLARYIRKDIDKKVYLVTPPDTVVETVFDVLFHLDDKVSFTDIPSYETYIRKLGQYTEGGAKVAVLGGMNNPFGGNRNDIDSMITCFQRSGINIYPISAFKKRLSYLKDIVPDAVVYFAHGRLMMGQSDEAVQWLKERNIPIFAPLSIFQTEAIWENDKMGMFGAMMSQNIVMPELDGGIYPYVVNAQEADKDGWYTFKAIPDRLESFTQIVGNFIRLKTKANADKRVAIYYLKGPGQSALVAQGLETAPALYQVLQRLRAEGYRVDNLPATASDFEKLLMTQGAVLAPYAVGAFDDYIKTGRPALYAKPDYEHDAQATLPTALYADLVGIYGEAPGEYLKVQTDQQTYLGVARVELGNIVLLPQPMAGLGTDAFAMVHGAKSPPPHTYVGSYLWMAKQFKADAVIHFGTHGSLEFTPQKQVALGNYDWSDRLIGTVPHFYYYSIGNIGESIIAKRRSYATLLSYLTPPFMESDMRGQFKQLQDRLKEYHRVAPSEVSEVPSQKQLTASLPIKKIAVGMGLHRDLRLDSVLSKPYTPEDVGRIERFAEEIANEKMLGKLYVTGEVYETSQIQSTVLAMSTDPIAYSRAALDKLRGKVTEKQLSNSTFFTQQYLHPAAALVKQVLGGQVVNATLIAQLAGVNEAGLLEAKTVMTPPKRSMSLSSLNSVQDTTQKYTPDEKRHARAVMEIERTVNNILTYREHLQASPELEMQAIVRALSGGYIAPSSGGDPVANAASAPTGRNMYAINAEATPSEVAWDKGIDLVKQTLTQYQTDHKTYPRKVSYTFWSSEFIESEGTTIAQALYMLGVQPVRDGFNRVTDLQLIPSETLGRPRIDVVIQTSGQFRDLAASRLVLLARAVEMAAAAVGDKYENYVANSTVEIERLLVNEGISPKDARELSTQRIFGGINGMYGTGIQGLVTSGDKWETEKEIADTYINNMGAVYSSTKEWGEFKTGLLRATLHNTDIVIHARQNNTWGALSLDHVYEFMGGMNLAVREVTGKDPEAYFADYRNRNKVRIQELKEAIGVESRSSIFNPAYIKEVMKGGASSAAQISDIVSNTYGWNVMKPAVIDKSIWDRLYQTYITDDLNLGVQAFFKTANPASMQEITAIMMETARKGMWTASADQLTELAKVHTDLVKEFGPSGSGFSATNRPLQQFIAQQVDAVTSANYQQQMQAVSHSGELNKAGVVMKNTQADTPGQEATDASTRIFVVVVITFVFTVLYFIVKRKRNQR